MGRDDTICGACPNATRTGNVCALTQPSGEGSPVIFLLASTTSTHTTNDDPLHYDISSPVVLAECPSCGVFGSCLTNGTCLCSPGYSGPRCEMHCPSLVANTRDACIASTTLRTCSGCSCFAGTAWNATLRSCAPNTKLCNFSNKTGALLSNHSCSIMHHPNDGSGLAETISSPAMLGV